MKRVSRWLGVSAAVILSLHALSAPASAWNGGDDDQCWGWQCSQRTPEIDPGSIPMGVALLAGGLLMMKARRSTE